MRYCKKISAALLIISLTFSCFACGTKEEPTPTDTGITNIEREEEQTEQNEEKEVSEEQVAAADQGSTEEQAEPEKKEEVDTAVLPKYEYPGPEAFYYFLYGYLIDTLGVNYTDYDVCIPCPVIICEEFEDKQDLRIYGDFWIFNYNLESV